MREISAGGVVFTKRGDDLLILLIEDRHGKMTLAKGKQETGETLEETALREILEETGVQGRLVAPIDTVQYTYIHPVAGEVVQKEVHYYLVEAITAEITAQLEEINAVQWLTPHDSWVAQQKRGYSNNQDVLKKAFSLLQIEV